MLKLIELPKDAYWLDLLFGVRFRVRPLTTIEYNTAKARNVRLLRALLEERQEIEAVGGSVVGLPDISDEDAQTGYAEFLMSVALAQSAVLEWEGVGDEEGNPLPLTHHHIHRLFLQAPRLAEQFWQQYTAPLSAMLSEGERSPAAANGTLAAGMATASSAEKRIPPAPEASGEITASAVPTSTPNPVPAPESSAGASSLDASDNSASVSTP